MRAVTASLKRRSRVFFFNDAATTEIYTLSLHDALPILDRIRSLISEYVFIDPEISDPAFECRDRKSTRLNSSHSSISYAVFCLKKKISLSVAELLDR